jgi:hypothetical protein
MIWFSPPVKYRAWWDTELSRKWNVTETIGRLWAKHLPPLPHPMHANDETRDDYRW